MSVDDIESFIYRKLEEYRCQTVPNAVQYLAELWFRLYRFSEKSKLEKYLFFLAYEWRYGQTPQAFDECPVETYDDTIVLLSDMKKLEYQKILPEYESVRKETFLNVVDDWV